MEAVKAEDMRWSRATKAGSSNFIMVILSNNSFSSRLKVKDRGTNPCPKVLGAASRVYVSLALFACACSFGPFHKQKETFSASFD